MTDREKQIEEIATMAVMACRRNPQAHKVKECIECEFKNGMCDSYRLAEALYNAGYRKIPEGAVVLTKEEYEKLFEDSFGIMTSSIGDLEINPEGMRKAVDEIARLIRVQNELQVINAKYYNEAKDLRRNMRILRQASYSITEVNYKIKEAKKEMAREILKEMVNTIKTQSVNDYNFDNKVIEEPILLEKLKEIATREGVEIKE